MITITTNEILELVKILIGVIFLIGIIRLVKQIVNELLVMKENSLTKDISITNEATEMLDTIIKETLDEITVLQLVPKKVIYIDNATEKEIVSMLSESIPLKLSPILLTKLSYKYDRDYIPSFIATRIYLSVLNFVLEYNVDNQVPETDSFVTKK